MTPATVTTARKRTTIRRPPDDLPDETLVSHAIDGDQDAFAQLVRRHRTAALSTATRIAGSHQAEDIVQDALLLAFRALRTLRDRAKFFPWLLTITRSRALLISRTAKSQSERTAHLESLDITALAGLISMPVEIVTEEDVLLKALARIPPIYAEVLRLHFLHEVPHARIAEALAVPVATIRWRCFHGKKLLRTVLQSESPAADLVASACARCLEGAACRGHRSARSCSPVHSTDDPRSPRATALPARQQAETPALERRI